MSSEDEDVRICPYRFCSAFLVMLVERVSATDATMIKRIPRHDIQHPVLNGPCHASLLAVGWTPDIPMEQAAQTMLLDREAIDNAKIPGLLAEESASQHAESLHPDVRPEGSYTLRGPHRMGREPVTPADEGDWQLGGREDEDSGHAALPNRADNPVPNHVQGIEVGKHVASAEEIVGQITTANINAGAAANAVIDAEAQINSAIGALESSMNNIKAAMGNLSPALLETYYRQMSQASINLHSCIQPLRNSIIAITAGQENGTEFIGRMLH